MRNQMLAIALLALGACDASQPPTQTAAPTTIPPALAEAAEAYESAQIAGDAAELQRLIADDYVLVGSDGARENKTQLIAFWTAEGFDPDPVMVVEPVQLLWSDGAALGGTVTLTGSMGGDPLSVTIRYIDIWALRDGQWRVVYGQTTRVP